MKATPLADKILIESENESDVAVINLITRGKVVCSSSLGRHNGERRATMLIQRYDETPKSGEGGGT